MILPRCGKKGAVPIARSLCRQIQMRFTAILPPRHRFVLVDVDFKGILCVDSQGAGNKQQQKSRSVIKHFLFVSGGETVIWPWSGQNRGGLIGGEAFLLE